MPLHLFIDTNVLLSFFHLSSDDLEELRKLVALIRSQAVQLHLPEQVPNEFARNRDAKVADALKRLKEQRLSLQFPQISKDYPEYEQLREAQRVYEQAHSNLLRSVQAHSDSQSLKADLVVRELFASTSQYSTAQVYAVARYRADIGNPPGKSGSIGDAINWETLLTYVPNGEDLWLISDDGDYASSLNAERFNALLMAEWQQKKASQVRFFRRLSTFFREKFPQIELATGVEKDVAIASLAASESYSDTHTAIAKLASFSDFTPAQATAIAQAAASNNQIYWIVGDEDVKVFLDKIVAHFGTDIEQSVLQALQDKRAEGS